MTYTPELAQAVATVHNVPAATVNTWKSRGKIPDKFFNPDGTIKAADRALTDTETYHLKRWIDDTNGALNLSAFKAVNGQQLADFSRGKGRISHRQYTGFKSELADLKNSAGKVFRAATFDNKVRALRAFLQDERVKPYRLGEKYPIECLTTGTTDPNPLEVETVIVNIGLLVQTLNL